MQMVFNVTALGALRMSNTLAAIILKSDTKLIVNISSEAGSISTSCRKSWFGYCMSKAAPVFDHKRYYSDKPAYIDYLGREME